MPSAFICIEKYFYKKTKKILGISKAIRVLSPPYYVFGNLSVQSIYSEVLEPLHP